MTASALVVGVGSPDAGDDAVGVLVASAVAALGIPHVDVLTREDPTDLTLAWRGRSRVVVVDAVHSGAAPGSVLVLDAADAAPLPSGRSSGTHDFGLASAVGLSRALGTLPDHLSIVGVEGVSFAVGDPVSAPVASAVSDAVAAVVRLLAGADA